MKVSSQFVFQLWILFWGAVDLEITKNLSASDSLLKRQMVSIIHVPMVQNLFTSFTWLFMIPHKKISKNRAQWWLHCYAIYLTIKFTFKHEICTSSSNWKSFSRSVLEILKPVFFSKVNQHWYLLFQLIEC